MTDRDEFEWTVENVRRLIQYAGGELDWDEKVAALDNAIDLIGEGGERFVALHILGAEVWHVAHDKLSEVIKRRREQGREVPESLVNWPGSVPRPKIPRGRPRSSKWRRNVWIEEFLTFERKHSALPLYSTDLLGATLVDAVVEAYRREGETISRDAVIKIAKRVAKNP